MPLNGSRPATAPGLAWALTTCCTCVILSAKIPRPRDDHSVSHILDRCTPIQKQLLDVSYSGGFGYTSPKEEDVPLKNWIEEHLGKEAVAP
ncbi:MAG: hypothetical protein O7G87_03510 [bacterium]|nr:hypothetical protein [bacterium]